jgi:hypothetical protein
MQCCFALDGASSGSARQWIELLKAGAFFTACSEASKAADYLRSLALAETIALSGAAVSSPLAAPQ